LNIWRLTK